jgi:phosphoglycerate kinase
MIEANVIQGKHLLLRADLDVPLSQGGIMNSYRLDRLLPTLKLCLSHAQSILIIGHLGRPVGEDDSLSLKPVKDWLEKSLNQSIYFISSGYSPGEWNRVEFPLALMENLRFSEKENKSDPEFAQIISAGSDIYVYDAFAAFHPSTSLHKIPEVLSTLTGLQFDLEVSSLSRAITKAEKPSLLLLSGAKNDKLNYLPLLQARFNQVILGGKLAPQSDLTVSGLDLNQVATNRILTAIKAAKTIVLNGPLGKFEDPNSATATKTVFHALKNSPAYTLLGGGDTLSAISTLGFNYSDFSFVSTGGGAMLEFMATNTHPLLEVLKNKSVN